MNPMRSTLSVILLVLVLGTVLAVLGLLKEPIVSADLSLPPASEASHTPEQIAAVPIVIELTPAADTRVDEDHPSTNYGTATNLVAWDGDYQWSLLQFDLSGLPPYFNVYSATLSLYGRVNRTADATASPQANELKADAITDEWGEYTVNWTSRPPSEHLLDPPTSFVVDGWTEWDVTNIVQAWGNGNLPNYGIRIRSDLASAGFGWWSRETAEPPKLTISYSAAPPPCEPITDVDVSGATSGVTGVSYDFAADTSPADADPPDEISWQVTGYADPLVGESVSLSWATPGEKTLTVEVTHCGGTTSTVHTVDISDPPVDCTVPLLGAAINGPLLIDTGASHEFRAISIPFNATDPVTFTWAATGQASIVDSTDQNESTQTYSWSTAGDMRIRVTAENCGGSAVVYHDVSVVDSADLPDLRVTSAWNDIAQGRIGYVMHNEGNSAVPSGFYVSLEQGSSTPAADPFPNALGAGDIGLGYIDHDWSCGTVSETVGVLADWTEDVVELDELNNLWSDIWTCDQQPPAFTSGPTVTSLTETRARIEFDTDEDCEGWVEFGTSPYLQSVTAPGSGLYATSHGINLNGLNGATTYYAAAFCTDAAGLTVNSAPLQFETDPPGTGPPVINSISVQQVPISDYEFWQVDVEMENDEFMDRVACSMDGTPLGIDYTADTSGDVSIYTLYISPHALGMTRAAFFDTHTFSCTAYRMDPNAFATSDVSLPIPGDAAYPVKVWIHEPHHRYKIYVDYTAIPGGVTMDVTVYAAAYEWGCTRTGVSVNVPPGLASVDCDDQPPTSVDTIELWVGGDLKDTVSPAPGELVETLTANMTGLSVGTHELKAVARKGAGANEDSQDLVVEQGDPGLEVTRSIRREDNKLKVTLDLHNAGTATAYVKFINDYVLGLQPIIERDTSTDPVHLTSIQDGDPLFDGSGARWKKVKIELEEPWVEIGPGEDFSVNYLVVPVLHEWDRPAAIGSIWRDTEVWRYDTTATLVNDSFDLSGSLVNDPSYGMLPLEDALANAVRLADYVIVTNPDRVYGVLATSGNAAAEKLFSNMAELASLKNGVLGFLKQYDTHPLDDLIEPDGWWAQALNPTFNEKDQGYVLLVGETEIIPSFYSGSSNFMTGPCCVDYVNDTDQPYTNTAGETARPELVVGRVIGNGLTQLNNYLENVIQAARGEPGYGYNRSRALLISGTGENVSDFKSNVNYVANQMDDDIADVNVFHWSSFDGDWTRIMTWTKQMMPDNGMIFWNGHGNAHQWGDGVRYWDFPGFYSLGDTNPGVLAASCKTGRYEDYSDQSIAEAFLAYGAGAYVGSTQSTEHESTGDAFRRGYSRWDTDESMGQALNRIERDIWGNELVFDHHKFWAYSTNLYGDPKYGRLEPPASARSEPAEQQGLEVSYGPQNTRVRLSLPALVFSKVGEWDYVEIPGGGRLADMGGYGVPVWTASLTFPAGRSVQDVQLVFQSQPTAYGDLSMKVLEGLDFGSAGQHDVTAAATADGWYPEMSNVYEWWTEKAPDGTTTLEIKVYPFYYHAESGDAIYHRGYQFEVETIDSTVSIASLQAPSTGKNPGGPVDLSLVLKNTGRPRDVIVQTSIRDWATNDPLGGLPLKTLHALEGTAAVELRWNTRRVAAGDYVLKVELLSPSGALLDKAVTEVRLGTTGARLNLFSASQETFAPGDQIKLTMGVVNTGTVPIEGTAVFLVQESDNLSATEIITAPVSEMAPGVARKLSVNWDSRGHTAYDYRVLGYVKFHSRATEPMALHLRRPRVFLPLIVRE